MKFDVAAETNDPRETPTYGTAEAVHYLRIPYQTLRYWLYGRGSAGPLIQIASRQPSLLSFMNLVELHVLNGMRRVHHVPLPRVRRAIDFLRAKYPSRHPLADRDFETDGLDLFIHQFDDIVNVSKSGQLGIKPVLRAYLRRIRRDPQGMARQLYPFTRTRSPICDFDEPAVVVIDPAISFGKPVLAGTGISTALIAERFNAGESIVELAQEYGREPAEVEEAIRCENQLAA